MDAGWGRLRCPGPYTRFTTFHLNLSQNCPRICGSHHRGITAQPATLPSFFGCCHILETLREFTSRSGVSGWIPASEAEVSSALTEKIARLEEENGSLREQVKNFAAAGPALFNGLTFEQMYKLLATTKIDTGHLGEENSSKLASVAAIDCMVAQGLDGLRHRAQMAPIVC